MASMPSMPTMKFEAKEWEPGEFNSAPQASGSGSWQGEWVPIEEPPSLTKGARTQAEVSKVAKKAREQTKKTSGGAAEEEKEKSKRIKRKQVGRMSTILTGGQGVETEPDLRMVRLLGE